MLGAVERCVCEPIFLYHWCFFLRQSRMNYCFNNDCPKGFAYFTFLPTRFDDFGSFRYIHAVQMKHNLTINPYPSSCCCITWKCIRIQVSANLHHDIWMTYYSMQIWIHDKFVLLQSIAINSHPAGFFFAVTAQVLHILGSHTILLLFLDVTGIR